MALPELIHDFEQGLIRRSNIWSDMFCSAIRAGHSSVGAIKVADAGVAHLDKVVEERMSELNNILQEATDGAS